jgi:methionyl-tRNA formyltransferase
MAGILFLGANALGHACCQRLLEMELPFCGIYTMPREFRISYSPDAPVRNVLHRDFAGLGERYGVPVTMVEGKMGGYAPAVEALRPDLILVIGWYHMVPHSLRELAPRGCVGIHGSLLPRYRGGAPLVWAMIHGEREAGVSLFHLADGVDDGDVVAQRSFPIGPDDSIREALARATAASVELVEKYVPLLLNGTAPRTPQDHSGATHFPQRSPEDGRIDWTWSAARIRDFVRAQTRPYPGAFTEIGGKRVTLWDADVLELEADG